METKNATDQNFNLLFLRNKFLAILEDFITRTQFTSHTYDQIRAKN